MEFEFLTILFFIGITIACLQDLKRREVDNWLNLFLIVFSLTFVCFGAVLSGDENVIFRLGFFMVVMFVVMNLFYYGRVFAGGDAKLLFAMSVFFLGDSFAWSMINLGVFILFLMIGGSIYGFSYSAVLWWKNKEKVNKEMLMLIRKRRWFFWIVFISAVLMMFWFVHFLFFIAGVLLFVFPFLFVFAKGLENVSMVREVLGSELREGDWLVNDVTVFNSKTKVIKADWDGLSLEDIELLKNKKKVLIKEGLPFVPAFLIAFVCYVFLRDWVLGLFLL